MSLQFAIGSHVIVGAAAKLDVPTARAPGTGDPEVEFVFAFLLTLGVLAIWHPKAILCTTKIKLNGSAEIHAC
jgi:hypothetical protein